MIKNYFKIALRNLQRNKGYTIINVIGLSLGIACGILIFTLITYHLSFDNFHNNKNRIYRIVSEYTYSDGIEHQQGVQQPLGKAFRTDYSLTDKVARVVVYRGGGLITLPNEPGTKKFIEEKGGAFAEPEFFDVFNFPLVQGDKATALTQPNSALITQQIAKKYFGTENAIGKIIRYKFFAAFINFKVTGILKDLPDNTDRKQEIYFSYSNLKDGNPKFASDDNWHTINSGMQCFVVLKNGVTAANAEKVFPAFAKKYLDKEDAKNTKYLLQPLSDVHFNTDYDGYADKKYLWSLAFVGIFLIVTACVNFINLATAQALNRAKEVGVRKVLGSLKTQLFWQFIAETSLITFFAVIIAFGFSQLAIPYLNNLFQTKMEINLLANMRLTGFLFLLIVLVIFLSGSYPGLVLSRFQPVAALKGKLSQKNVGGFSLRRILVVAQFAISQMLIIGTIVIAGQMHFSKTTDLGFNKNEIVMLPVASTDSVGKIKMQTLKNKLLQVPGVSSVSFCTEAPASMAVHGTDIHFDNRPQTEPFDVSMKTADENYLQTFDIKLVAGRNVYPADSAIEFLINETLVKKLGAKNPQDIINKNIKIGEKTAPVVGVVKDFYDQSFHNDKSAIIILPNYKSYYNCAVKISAKDAKASLASFEKIWNQTYPDYLYSYQFLDERISKFYELDDIMLKLIEAFACIAIFIGCLGLYGLVSFMALQKTKEIGVRKVLGASVQSVLWLFGKEFSKLLIIAFVIAAPVAWFAMNKYLQDFKYRIQIGSGIFVLAILSTFIIAACTVAYRAIKAASINPVKSLKTE